MPQISQIRLMPEFVTNRRGVGKLKLSIPLKEKFQMRTYVTQEETQTEKYISPTEGMLIVDMVNELDNVVADVNYKGELILIAGINYDWDIDGDGNLIVKEVGYPFLDLEPERYTVNGPEDYDKEVTVTTNQKYVVEP